MNFKKITEQLKQILNESPMYQNPRKDFEEFYDFVKSGIEPKKSYFLFDNKLRIPTDTVKHSFRRHMLSKEQWQTFLDNYENVIDQNPGKKAKYNGNPIKYLIEITSTRHFGCVIEYFSNEALPILTTVFEDHINSIKEWLHQEV